MAPLRAAAWEAWPEVPPPPEAEVAAVASNMVFNGVSMRATTFKSSRSSEEIVAFYARLWGKQAVTGDMAGWRVVGHPQDGYYLTVQVRAEGQGSTGHIGVMRITDRDPPKPGSDFPTLPGTRVPNDIRYPDDRPPVRTLLLINSRTPYENASFYERTLAAQQWQKVSHDACRPGASQCTDRYVRGTQNMDLSMASGENAQTRIVVILLN
ncbi:hypothetical protein DVT68_08340 [Dyella solisilvae]|uniref:Uncharacterized protein n=2 Tax=Dyella solisilvae TaxID=1920168 RepID=A0A370K919_9GAMM|nr:hypothetical protein DVT68_08340 [Dyella solisilvae]